MQVGQFVSVTVANGNGAGIDKNVGFGWVGIASQARGFTVVNAEDITGSKVIAVTETVFRTKEAAVMAAAA